MKSLSDYLKNRYYAKRGSPWVKKAGTDNKIPGIIKKILKHLGLWHVKRKTPPPAHAPPANQLTLYDDASGPSVDDLLVDPQYPVEADF